MKVSKQEPNFKPYQIVITVENAQDERNIKQLDKWIDRVSNSFHTTLYLHNPFKGLFDGK